VSTFTVRQGKRYRATISLNILEQFADNEMIAGELRSAGFTDVHVTGSGGTRTAVAAWPLADATAPMPAAVIDVTELEA
jgi:hypothetical protein